MHRRDLFSIGSWVGIALTCWIIAWIIADAIPVFSDLLSLIVSSTTAPLLSLTNLLSRALFSPVGSVMGCLVYTGCTSTGASGFRPPERSASQSSTCWLF